MSNLLTEEDVEIIFDRLREGERGTSIARDFAVSQQTISSIATGRTWGHVTGLKPREPRPRMVTKAKLTEEQVKEIRRELQENGAHGRQRVLALKYGVSDTTIHAIKTGKTWSH